MVDDRLALEDDEERVAGFAFLDEVDAGLQLGDLVVLAMVRRSAVHFEKSPTSAKSSASSRLGPIRPPAATPGRPTYAARPQLFHADAGKSIASRINGELESTGCKGETCGALRSS